VTPEAENIPSIVLLRTDFIFSLICSLLAKGFASPVVLELEELVSSTITYTLVDELVKSSTIPDTTKSLVLS
jgi:hypothetical protein